MLLSLLLAGTLLTQAPPSPSHAVKLTAKPSLSKTRLSFVVSIPPIPAFGVDTLHLSPSRALIPLTATLSLDGSAEVQREEGDLIAAINTERTSRGLGPLVSDPALTVAACAHSREMCDLNYFAHSSPTPGDATPADRYLNELHTAGETRPENALVGENIFFASVTSDVYNADYAHRALMASPHHRANILEPRFTEVGVGLYRDPQGRFWVTEMFEGGS